MANIFWALFDYNLSSSLAKDSFRLAASLISRLRTIVSYYLEVGLYRVAGGWIMAYYLSEHKIQILFDSFKRTHVILSLFVVRK